MYTIFCDAHDRIMQVIWRLPFCNIYFFFRREEDPNDLCFFLRARGVYLTVKSWQPPPLFRPIQVEYFPDAHTRQKLVLPDFYFPGNEGRNNIIRENHCQANRSDVVFTDISETWNEDKDKIHVVESMVTSPSKPIFSSCPPPQTEIKSLEDSLFTSSSSQPNTRNNSSSEKETQGNKNQNEISGSFQKRSDPNIVLLRDCSLNGSVSSATPNTTSFSSMQNHDPPNENNVRSQQAVIPFPAPHEPTATVSSSPPKLLASQGDMSDNQENMAKEQGKGALVDQDPIRDIGWKKKMERKEQKKKVLKNIKKRERRKKRKGAQDKEEKKNRVTYPVVEELFSTRTDKQDLKLKKYKTLPCEFESNENLLQILKDIIFSAYLLIGLYASFKYIRSHHLRKDGPVSSEFMKQSRLKIEEGILFAQNPNLIIRMLNEANLTSLSHFSLQLLTLQSLVTQDYDEITIKNSLAPELLSLVQTLNRGAKQLSDLAISQIFLLMTDTGRNELLLLTNAVKQYIFTEGIESLPLERQNEFFRAWTQTQTLECLFLMKGSSLCKNECYCLERYCSSQMFSNWVHLHKIQIPLICLSYHHQEIIVNIIQSGERKKKAASLPRPKSLSLSLPNRSTTGTLPAQQIDVRKGRSK
jgi:hypothetical protein